MTHGSVVAMCVRSLLCIHIYIYIFICSIPKIKHLPETMVFLGDLLTFGTKK